MAGEDPDHLRVPADCAAPPAARLASGFESPSIEVPLRDSFAPA